MYWRQIKWLESQTNVSTTVFNVIYSSKAHHTICLDFACTMNWAMSGKRFYLHLCSINHLRTIAILYCSSLNCYMLQNLRNHWKLKWAFTTFCSVNFLNLFCKANIGFRGKTIKVQQATLQALTICLWFVLKPVCNDKCQNFQNTIGLNSSYISFISYLLFSYVL